MVNHSLERALEMKRLRAELKQCPQGSVESERRWARIDELLDSHNEAKGVHAPECSCPECLAHVADVLAHRLGDCVDPRDVAIEGQW